MFLLIGHFFWHLFNMFKYNCPQFLQNNIMVPSFYLAIYIYILWFHLCNNCIIFFISTINLPTPATINPPHPPSPPANQPPTAKPQPKTTTHHPKQPQPTANYNPKQPQPTTNPQKITNPHRLEHPSTNPQNITNPLCHHRKALAGCDEKKAWEVRENPKLYDQTLSSRHHNPTATIREPRERKGREDQEGETKYTWEKKKNYWREQNINLEKPNVWDISIKLSVWRRS